MLMSRHRATAAAAATATGARPLLLRERHKVVNHAGVCIPQYVNGSSDLALVLRKRLRVAIREIVQLL